MITGPGAYLPVFLFFRENKKHFLNGRIQEMFWKSSIFLSPLPGITL
jgi:hypothetical protein